MIEVLRQARNAFVWNLNTDLDNIPACEKWAEMLRKNIDDLDKAIAELESQEPVAWINAEKRTFEWNGPVLWNTPTVAVLDKIPLYTTPPTAQASQEPALWEMPDGKTVDKWGLKFYGGQAGKPLYTTPQPQRTWVGLTDEEHHEIVLFAESGDWHDFEVINATEAKLKEKNNA
jgi:hypothetical protein